MGYVKDEPDVKHETGGAWDTGCTWDDISRRNRYFEIVRES
jgi:hypothetical protein